MEETTWQILLGPYGLTVGAVLVAGGAIRAAWKLYETNQDLHQKRIDDQERYLDLVESQKGYHIEAQKVLTKTIVVMERVETQLDNHLRSGQ